MDNLWRPVRDQLRAYRAQIRFCLRMTVAGLLALAVVEPFPFPLHGLWTVLTAVVVTQASVGGSLRATIEYMIGTSRRGHLRRGARRAHSPHDRGCAGSRSRACDRPVGACGGDQSELSRRGLDLQRAERPEGGRLFDCSRRFSVDLPATGAQSTRRAFNLLASTAKSGSRRKASGSLRSP